MANWISHVQWLPRECICGCSKQGFSHVHVCAYALRCLSALRFVAPKWFWFISILEFSSSLNSRHKTVNLIGEEPIACIENVWSCFPDCWRWKHARGLVGYWQFLGVKYCTRLLDNSKFLYSFFWGMVSDDLDGRYAGHAI